MTSTEMTQWWNQLDATAKADWLHAYQNGPTAHVVMTLPASHRPGGGDEWITVADGEWVDGPAATEWFFATEFKAFIAEQYEESVGGTPL